MSTVSSVNYNRVSGLASGIDYESIIKNLMQAQRAPLDKLNQDKTVLEWKQQDYTELAKKAYAFNQKVFDMEFTSYYRSKDVRVNGSSVANVTAGTQANNGTYNIDVKQLATAAYMTSTIDLPTAYNDDGGLKTMGEQFGILDDTGKFTISNGESSKEITVDFASDTIANLVAKINESDTGVTASYDDNLHRFFITSNSTGSSNVISYTDADVITGGGEKDFLNELMGLPQSSSGKDAVFEVNGAVLTQPANTFQITGLNISLAGKGKTSIIVGDDTDYIYDQVKGILNDYNDLISEINEKISEKRYLDYKPLTDDQRDQLSDTQQEKWEEKAKSGLLKSDPILSNLLFSMREAIYSKADGADPSYDMLADLGITTGKWYENGKLYIDDNKLKDSTKKDPDAVISLMKNVMSNMHTQLNDGLNRIKRNSGDYLGIELYDQSFMARQIRDINDRILDTQDRLSNIEDRYYRQFTRMEQMISQMNAQSAWLSQQFQ